MQHAQPDPERSDSRLTFPRTHRLKRRRLIRALFDRSREDVGTVAAGTIRILYRIAPQDEVGADAPLQIGFAAGRAARSGVARTRIRRVLREVYRVNQTILVDLFRHRDDVLTMMVLFRGRDVGAATSVAHDLPQAMRRLRQQILAGESSPGKETGP